MYVSYRALSFLSDHRACGVKHTLAANVAAPNNVVKAVSGRHPEVEALALLGRRRQASARAALTSITQQATEAEWSRQQFEAGPRLHPGSCSQPEPKRPEATYARSPNLRRVVRGGVGCGARSGRVHATASTRTRAKRSAAMPSIYRETARLPLGTHCGLTRGLASDTGDSIEGSRSPLRFGWPSGRSLQTTRSPADPSLGPDQDLLWLNHAARGCACALAVTRRALMDQLRTPTILGALAGFVLRASHALGGGPACA